MLKLFLLFLAASTAGCKSLQGGGSDVTIRGGSLTSADAAVGTIVDLATSKTICTATLYTTTRAVTAAHCLAGMDVSKLGFAVDLSGDRRVVAIHSAAVHPGFSLGMAQGQENSTADIAFFEMKEPLPVTPIPVAIDGKGLVPGAQTLVVGYGHEHQSFDTQRGEVRTGSGVKRAAVFTVSRVDPIQIIYSEVGPATLHGDSGGPHLRTLADGSRLIVGITSYGANSQSTSKPLSVANRVDAYADFLGSLPGKPEPTRTPVTNCANYPEPGGRCVLGEVHVCAEAFGGFFEFRVRCDYPQTCGLDPQTALAQCMLVGSKRTVTLVLYDQVLVEGSLVKGPSLGRHYVFVDPPPGRSIALNPDVPRTDANGRVRITTSEGPHTIKVASPEHLADYTTLPEFPLKLDASTPKKIEYSLVTTPIELRIQAPPLSPGWSVYLAGRTDLMGNYRTASRLTYDPGTQRWVYRGFLPQGLEVRALIASSTAGQVDLTQWTRVLWDKNGPITIDQCKVDWVAGF